VSRFSSGFSVFFFPSAASCFDVVVRNQEEQPLMGRLNGKHWESHLTTESPPPIFHVSPHPSADDPSPMVPSAHQWFPPSTPIYFFRLNPTVIDPPAPSILDGLFFFFLFSSQNQQTAGGWKQKTNPPVSLSFGKWTAPPSIK
jgi:hypothetical protein